MSQNTTGRVKHPPINRIPRPIGNIQSGDQFFAFLSVDDSAVDTLKLSRGHIHAHGLYGRLAVGQIQVAAIIEHQVEIEFLGQNRPQIQRLLIEGKVFLGSLVGPHNGRIATGPAEPDIPFFNHRDIFHAVLARKEIGGGQSMQPAADDNRIISGFHFGRLPPQAFCFESHR